VWSDFQTVVNDAQPLEPSVLWFTGLSGAGKSTIAREVCERLLAAGARVEYLDGDAIRDVFPNTGFTRPERDAHVRRVGYVASRLEHHGVFVVCALISPYLESREAVRRLCRRFFEIHVSTPLHECERRDVKGLYERARRGAIANFTGIDDMYEPPPDPELRLDTTVLSVQDAADLVMSALETGGQAARTARAASGVTRVSTAASVRPRRHPVTRT
jgi:adenylylsulfate kinase